MFGKKNIEIKQEATKNALSADKSTFNDELHDVQKSNDEMLEHLRQINSILKYVTEMDYIKDMLLGVNKQALMIENVASSSEEMTASIEDISHFVQDSSAKANNSIKISNASIRDIEIAFSDILKSFEESKKVQSTMESVKKEADKINDMVTIIKGVADQTNLLALNASIEAARAGEQGRGFAVVADEIKKLAENTKQQVEFIRNTVTHLTNEIHNTSVALEASNTSFKKGKENLDDAVGKLEAMKHDLTDISSTFIEISANVEEQTAASEEMSSSIMVVNEETKTLHIETEKTGRAINSVSSLLNSLRMDILNTGLTLDLKTQLEVCICDHLMWRWRVYNMILGYEKLSETEVGTHHTCRLGKWCDNAHFTDRDMCVAIDEMSKPHEALHDIAKKAIKAYNNGNKELAEKLLHDIDKTSQEVVGYLNKMKKISKNIK